MHLIGCALVLKENKEAKILEKPSVNVIGCKANSIRVRKFKNCGFSSNNLHSA